MPGSRGVVKGARALPLDQVGVRTTQCEPAVVVHALEKWGRNHSGRLSSREGRERRERL
jgi:hypothetical protein